MSILVLFICEKRAREFIGGTVNGWGTVLQRESGGLGGEFELVTANKGRDVTFRSTSIHLNLLM